MAQAGVQLYSLFAIVCDLMRDWRNTPGAKEVLPYLDKYMRESCESLGEIVG